MTALTRKATILITAIAAVGVLIFYRLADISAAWMPKCPLHHLTGLRCPGCGTQRALHALLNGDPAAAWHHNAAMICSIPLILILATASLARKKHPAFYLKANSSLTAIIAGTLLILWGILRNLLSL